RLASAPEATSPLISQFRRAADALPQPPVLTRILSLSSCSVATQRPKRSQAHLGSENRRGRATGQQSLDPPTLARGRSNAYEPQATHRSRRGLRPLGALVYHRCTVRPWVHGRKRFERCHRTPIARAL